MMTGPTAALERLAEASFDPEAWEALAVDQGERLRALASCCCADRAAAEDAVQEALILARRDAWQFRPRPGTDPDAQAGAWLAGIVINCARRQVRAAIRRAARHRRAGARAGTRSPTPPDPVVRQETAAIVRAAVAGLPADAAQAVSLRYFADLDYAAIAQAIGTSEAAARKRVTRGLAALRRRLARIGTALGLMALIRHLRGAEVGCPPALVPPSLFRPEILTMPRILAAAGCLAAGFALWLGLVVLAPPRITAAESREPISAPPIPDVRVHTPPVLPADAEAVTPLQQTIDVEMPVEPAPREALDPRDILFPDEPHPPVLVGGNPPPDADVRDPVPAIPAGDGLPVLVAGNTTFALDLYRRLATTIAGDVVLGPASISEALALAEAGAAGETRAEFHRSLRWEGLGEGLHPAWKALTDSWRAAEGIDLVMANRLYHQQGDPLKAPYLASCKEHHGAEPQACDFAWNADGERKVINAWVGERTRTRIPELLPAGSITPLTRAVLVNACYFKGFFLTPFEIEATQAAAPFHAPTGPATCALMRQEDLLEHWGDDAVDVVRLAYGDKDKRLPAAHLLLVVPKQVDGLAAIEADLTSERLAAWTTGLESKMIFLALPRFTSRTPVELGKTLQAMGLRRAFGEADFSRMVDGEMFISEVIHEAWIATDEAGSEAAAATAVVMAGGVPPPAEVRVVADRPFLWLITDAATGSVLFVGRVVKPEDPGPAKE